MEEIKIGVKKGERAFRLCPDKGDCCPVVKISGEEAVIIDDFGGTVRMSLNQLREIKKVDI